MSSLEEASTSEEKYKVIEYNERLFRIPVRRLGGQGKEFILLSDVQSIIPTATALTSSDKLIPFEIDPNTHQELLPKRVAVSEYETVWQVHVPNDCAVTDSRQTRILCDMETKLDQLSQQLGRLLRQFPVSTTVANRNDTIRPIEETTDEETSPGGTSTSTSNSSMRPPPPPPRATSPPPAFTSTPLPSSRISRSVTTVTSAHAAALGIEIEEVELDLEEQEEEQEQEACGAGAAPPAITAPEAPPPSYETSILGNIKALTDQLRVYESHIPNRHKSPRWLAQRSEWVRREPSSIEQVAYQLVNLEMALLWTAVSEGWLQERETWLTLVASARSERHLAGALLNLERHTLVMDDSWINVREGWINELLEMIVLPLTHG